MVPPLLADAAMLTRSALLLTICALAACESKNDPLPDAGGSKMDAGVPDSGAPDSGAPDTGTPPIDGGYVELVTCPLGQELEFYSWSELSQVPSASQLEFASRLPNGAQVFSATAELSARFDVCSDTSGAHTLRGILWAFEDLAWPYYFVVDQSISAPVQGAGDYRGGHVYEVRLPPANLVVQGLDEALSGDLQPLEIRAINMQGLLIAGHDGFVAGVNANVGPSSITNANLYAYAGGLAAGDTFAARVCPFGEGRLTQTFSMGTATFEIEACTFLGGGFTTGYRITRLAVTDTNDALAPAERETITFEGDAAVTAVMNYVWNHHNACDSFHLALPHADYAATSAPAAGCGIAVPNAPMRSINEDPNNPVKYRVRYHQGQWTDGEIPGCTHYMFCD